MNNEEAIETCRMRLISSLTGWDAGQLEENPSGAEELFARKGGGKIHLIGGVSHITDVEKYIQQFNPVVTVIDQGPKVMYPGKDLDSVERKQKLYNRLRELAKKYNTAIMTVGQADAEADNRKFLTLNNLDGSKVGIPGELDWCMGIGKLDDEAYAGTRFLSICKNKLRGATGHGIVLLDVPRCRFTDSK
jgi:replicative DNA helicase